MHIWEVEGKDGGGGDESPRWKVKIHYSVEKDHHLDGGNHGLGHCRVCCHTKYFQKMGGKEGSPGTWPLGVQLPASHPPGCPCWKMQELLRKEELKDSERVHE